MGADSLFRIWSQEAEQQVWDRKERKARKAGVSELLSLWTTGTRSHGNREWVLGFSHQRTGWDICQQSCSCNGWGLPPSLSLLLYFWVSLCTDREDVWGLDQCAERTSRPHVCACCGAVGVRGAVHHSRAEVRLPSGMQLRALQACAILSFSFLKITSVCCQYKNSRLISICWPQSSNPPKFTYKF